MSVALAEAPGVARFVPAPRRRVGTAHRRPLRFLPAPSPFLPPQGTPFVAAPQRPGVAAAPAATPVRDVPVEVAPLRVVLGGFVPVPVPVPVTVGRVRVRPVALRPAARSVSIAPTRLRLTSRGAHLVAFAVLAATLLGGFARAEVSARSPLPGLSEVAPGVPLWTVPTPAAIRSGG